MLARILVLGLALISLAAPLDAEAQVSGWVPRVGFSASPQER
jgi:hypothetical protein